MSAAWIAYLLDVATERTRCRLGPYLIPDDVTPVAFVTALFRAIAEQPVGITRHGLDTMMDLLFAIPEMIELLKHPKEYQDEVADAIGLRLQHDVTDAFRAQWTHIIVPAWNQHTEIRKAMDGTSL